MSVQASLSIATEQVSLYYKGSKDLYLSSLVTNDCSMLLASLLVIDFGKHNTNDHNIKSPYIISL